MSTTWTLDVDALPEVLGWLGVSDPKSSEVLDALEARVGGALSEETRMLIRAAPELRHPHASGHPEIEGLPFAAGLPDVDAFLANLGQELLGRYLTVAHFCGAIPIGARLQYGAFNYAFARIEPWDARHAGVLYYDEGDVDAWASTVAGFLREEVVRFREEIDGQFDGLDEDEQQSFEPDLDHARDCFLLEGCDWKGPTRPGEAWGGEAWKAASRRDRVRYATRGWISSFLGGRVDARLVRALPTLAAWEREKDEVGVVYADSMYWVLAHALLGNEAELAEALSRAERTSSTHVRALCEAAPGLVSRFEGQRAALYELAARTL